MSARCSSCRSRIEWCVTERRPSAKDPDKMIGGSAIPVDPEPVVDGNMIKNGRDDEGTRIMRVLRKTDKVEPGTLRYASHYATCPNAKQHRRT